MTVMQRELVDLLRSPASGSRLRWRGDRLETPDGKESFPVLDGIPLFAGDPGTVDARVQQQHYDRVAAQYIENLTYPHTQEYFAYLDRAFHAAIDTPSLGTVGEICCGSGEAGELLEGRFERVIGIDVSTNMLRAAQKRYPDARFVFIQGDATDLPLQDESLDSVVILGGIHHVNDRAGLFSEVRRVLKPGGRFYFREPVDDFFLWRAIRKVVYRLSPGLDHLTEQPLRHAKTRAQLVQAGLTPLEWKTYGFLGFCLFMNSDILVFNRLFRHLPGVRTMTRAAAAMDDFVTRRPLFSERGLVVVGSAERPQKG